MTKKISDIISPPVPSNAVKTQQARVVNTRNGILLGVWSERAPRSGAVTNIRAIEMLLAIR